MTKETGGQAFPRSGKGWNENSKCSTEGDQTDGMTLLDYFAGQAVIMHRQGDSDNWSPKSLAKFAYEVADEMLAEKNKREV